MKQTRLLDICIIVGFHGKVCDFSGFGHRGAVGVFTFGPGDPNTSSVPVGAAVSVPSCSTYHRGSVDELVCFLKVCLSGLSFFDSLKLVPFYYSKSSGKQKCQPVFENEDVPGEHYFLVKSFHSINNVDDSFMNELRQQNIAGMYSHRSIYTETEFTCVFSAARG